MKKADFAFNVIRAPIDLAALTVAGIATYVVRTNILDAYRPVLFGPELPLGKFLWLAAGGSALFILSYALSGLYAMKLRMSKAQEIARIVVSSSGAIMIAIVVIFLRQTLFNSRFLVVGYWLVAMCLVVAGRMFLRAARRYLLVRYGIGAHRALLIGNDDVTERLDRTMTGDPGLGWRMVRRLSDPDMDDVAFAVNDLGVDEVVLANPDYPANRIIPLVDFCHERHLTFKFVPNIYQTLTTHYDVDSIGRIPVIELRRTALGGWWRVFKRVYDIALAVAALTALSPLFAIIAFAVKWETRGPVFVRLRRVSRNMEFGLVKFRSMIENAEQLKPHLATYNERSDGPLFKMKDDPRVTQVGRFIRRARLDELPQFWNVLVGDISVVGPRPHQPDEVARYTKHHRRVLAIKAGVTGMAQVSGSSDLPFEEEVSLDTFYIENWSLALDIRLVAKTIVRIFTDRSAV